MTAAAEDSDDEGSVLVASRFRISQYSVRVVNISKQARPTQSHTTLDAASASLVSNALQQGLQQQQQQQQGAAIAQTRSGLGNREADGGWCISWCKDRYWGEIIAAGCGTNGLIKVLYYSSI
jgi:hypothetical protein